MTNAELIELLERANCAFPAQISVSNHLDYCVFCRDKKALLTALRSGEVVLVPKEPTPEMLVAARDWSHFKYGKPVGNDGASGCYKAMIACAKGK